MYSSSSSSSTNSNNNNDECQLSTRFSCQCSNCVVGGAIEKKLLTTNDNEHQEDSIFAEDFFLPFTTTTSSSSSGNSTSTTRHHHHSDNDENNNTFPTSTSSSSSLYSTTTSSTKTEKSLARNKKWQKKLRRLQFVERLSVNSSANRDDRFVNPRRGYYDFPSEFYEAFNLEAPKSVSNRMYTAMISGIFYPKNFYSHDSVVRINNRQYRRYTANQSIFSSSTKINPLKLQMPKVWKKDTRGESAYDEKMKHHRKDKIKWLVKRKRQDHLLGLKKDQEEFSGSACQENEDQTYQDEEAEEEEEDEEEETHFPLLVRKYEQKQSRHAFKRDAAKNKYKMNKWDKHETTRDIQYNGYKY